MTQPRHHYSSESLRAPLSLSLSCPHHSTSTPPGSKAMTELFDIPLTEPAKGPMQCRCSINRSYIDLNKEDSFYLLHFPAVQMYSQKHNRNCDGKKLQSYAGKTMAGHLPTGKMDVEGSPHFAAGFANEMTSLSRSPSLVLEEGTGPSLTYMASLETLSNRV